MGNELLMRRQATCGSGQTGEAPHGKTKRTADGVGRSDVTNGPSPGFLSWPVLIALALLPGFGGWGNGPGAGDAAHFLRAGIGARARGMGGAFVAVADDATACFWNPAGLAHHPGIRLGGAYESRYGGLSAFQYLCGTVGSSAAGAGVLWVHSDLYAAYYLSAAAARDAFSLGLNAKFYEFSAPGQGARGFGLDIGALYELPLQEGRKLTLGLASADMGWSVIRWQGAGIEAIDHAAWVTRLGAALISQGDKGRWLGTADIEIGLRRPPLPGEGGYLPHALQLDLSLGVEVWLEVIALRAGLADISFGAAEGPSARPSLGVGIRVGGLTLDVAWTFSQLGSTYLLSIEFQD